MNDAIRYSSRLVVGQTLTAVAVTLCLSFSSVFAAQQEKNPPGDIPDSQVFVSYQSPLGLSLKVPEAWARTERADGARFADKYNAVDVSVTPATVTPTEASAKSVELPALVKAGNNAEPGEVDSVTLKGGPAILIRYNSDSDANPVTHRQLRLEHERYLFYHDGRQAALDLSAPVGADNADQWRLMANSLRWN
ncbi:hypothetical protein [Pseudomonas sp.]|uniref:hypothetical protein n=1 Tax=Pseudomonas sp. TaxID=306 RepID=UPI003264470A